MNSTNYIKTNVYPKDYNQKPSSIVIGKKFNTKKGVLENIYEVSIISKKIAFPQNVFNGSYDDFVEYITIKGRTFANCVMGRPDPKDKRNAGYCREQKCASEMYILAEDFDNNETAVEKYGYVTWQDILKRSQDLGLDIWFIYPTMTYKEERQKFRVVWKLPVPITDWCAMKATVLAMQKLFPESDTKCTSLGQLFFGSNSGTFYRNDDAYINIAELYSKYFLKVCHPSNTHRLREFRKLCTDSGVAMGAKVPQIDYFDKIENSGESAANVYSYLYKCDDLAQKVAFSFSVTEEHMRYGGKARVSVKNTKDLVPQQEGGTPVVKIRDFDLTTATENCQFLRESISGQKWLREPELCFQLSHMINIEGGMKIMEMTLSSRDDCVGESYDEGERKSQFCEGGTAYLYFKQHEYHPYSCLDNCEYYNNCSVKYILNAGKKGKQITTRIADDTTITLDETRDMLRDAFEETIQSEDKFTAIRVDVGTGKTYTMEDKMIEDAVSGKKVIYCASTHRLDAQTGREIDDKITKTGADIQVFRFTEIECYLPEQLQNEVRFLQMISSYPKAASKVHEWVKEKYNECHRKPPEELTDEDNDIISYVRASEALRSINNTVCIIIMTHARYINTKGCNADITYIDEDILKKYLVNISEFKLVDLKKLYKAAKDNDIKGSDALKSLTDLIEDSASDIIIPMPSISYNSDDFVDLARMKIIKPESNVLEFLTRNTEAFSKSSYHKDDTIYFVSKRTLPDIKTIIASATINKTIYAEYFGDKLKMYDFPATEIRGRLLQYTKKGYSNNSVNASVSRNLADSSKGILSDFKSYCEGKNVICTKNVKKLAEKAGIAFNCIGTFGGVEGDNTYKGLDLIVFGILHQPAIVYHLFAYALGHKTGIGDGFVNQSSIIERNNFRFSFNTISDDPFLQEVQFCFLEEAIIQAMGRARLVENDCTVTVYTNLPLPHAEILD